MLTHQLCAFCGVCHICGHRTRCKFPGRVGPHPQTQKARGLLNLFGAFPEGTTEILAVFRNLGDLDELEFPDDTLCGEVFVRPCPIRPRHGFVNSIATESIARIRKVIMSTLEADSGGEVIITRLVDAEFNFIWTPKLLTTGKGHDGATSGSHTVSLPLAGVVPPTIAKLLKPSGIGKGEDPYIEGVVKGKSSILTQLRAGPRLVDITPNYVPRPMTVSCILKAEGDLLAWERVIRENKENTGLVIYHPGGSLTDHYTVHARSFGIPVILEGDVKIGDVLIPTPSVVKPSPEAVLRGMIVGSTYHIDTNPSKSDFDRYLRHTTPILALLLTSLHHSSAMGGENGKWIGFGAVMMARLGVIALRGEVRYLRPHSLRGDRASVYMKVLNRSLSRQRACLASLTNLLMFGDFQGGSIGGPAWARCGGALTRLFTAIGDFSKHPSDEGVGELLRSLNEAVNQAHNGGWWMNKFGSPELFDEIQQGDPIHIGLSSRALLRANDLFSKLTPSEVSRFQSAWAKWPETIISPIALIGATVKVWPGSGLEITIDSRLFRGTEAGARTFHIPVNWTTAPAMLSEISVLPIEGGIQIIQQKGKSASRVLWEESITKFEKSNQVHI